METRGDSDLIDRFVRRHYRWPGVLRLHRNALGWDLLRAPANVAVSPLFLLFRLLALLAGLVRLRRVARFFAALRPQFASDIGRALERDLMTEVILPRGLPDTPGLRRMVADHVAVRAAVSEIAAALILLCVGLMLFSAVTPGVISLAPVVTEHAAHAREVADFWLGETLGRAWYGVFPSERPLWQTLLVGVALSVAISLATTFSGLVTDPIQARLGIHRRRLRRLLRRIDAGAEQAGIEGEFVLARGADIVDLATMLIRFLRP